MKDGTLGAANTNNLDSSSRQTILQSPESQKEETELPEHILQSGQSLAQESKCKELGLDSHDQSKSEEPQATCK